jgi:RNA methyltransferase, TrmH family
MQTGPHQPITSKENNAVKYLRSLSDPRIRKKERAFLIEGVKMVEEALRDSLGVIRIVATPDLVQHHGKGVLKLADIRSADILWISRNLMDAVSENKTPQPVMAVMKKKKYDEDVVWNHTSQLIVIAHHLQDPGNLGTILRTAEAVGASGVIVTANTVDPYNAKTIRASMGSILRVPLVQIGDMAVFIQACKRKGYQTVAAVLRGEKPHFAIDLTKPTVLILGQESSGLPQNIMADVDLQVHIPMSEAVDSLNVATAAAVLLYEAMRQRLCK